MVVLGGLSPQEKRGPSGLSLLWGPDQHSNMSATGMGELGFSFRSHWALHTLLYLNFSVPYTMLSQLLGLHWQVSCMSSYVLLAALGWPRSAGFLRCVLPDTRESHCKCKGNQAF